MNEKLITSLLIEILKKHNYKYEYYELHNTICYIDGYVYLNDFLLPNIDFYKMLEEFEQSIKK